MLFLQTGLAETQRVAHVCIIRIVVVVVVLVVIVIYPAEHVVVVVIVIVVVDDCGGRLNAERAHLFDKPLLVLVLEEDAGGGAHRTPPMRAQEHPVGLPVEDEAQEAEREHDEEPCDHQAES